MSDFFICPHCGAEVDQDATVCPECGSDEETGWSEDTRYDGLFLVDDDGIAGSSGGSRPWVKYAVITALALTLLSFISVTIPWGIYLIPLMLVAAIAAYFYFEVLPKTQSRKEKKIYESLLTRAGGDAGMVERWISYERRQTPEADEVDLMEAALYRWQRDNR